MFKTTSISELQRAGKKAFQSDFPLQYVLSNNQKSGLILSQEALEVLEQSGLLEELENRLLGYHMDVTYDSDDFVDVAQLK